MAAHRYWRVTKIKVRDPLENSGDRAVKQLIFITSTGLESKDPTKLAVKSAENGGSGDKATIIDDSQDNLFVSQQNENENWWVSYDFTQKVEVPVIKYVAWGLYGHEWVIANVEYSDNGMDWYWHGTIKPSGVLNFEGLQVLNVWSENTVNAHYMGDSNYLKIYTGDESGSFSGLVTQGESGEPKTPLKAEVLLYDRMTNRLLQRTWSDELGAYNFSGLDAGREYYAVTLHPSRTYNAANRKQNVGLLTYQTSHQE